MNRLFRFMGGHLPSRRRIIQLYAALLYNADLRGWLKGKIYTGPLKKLCVPGLNCYSCPAAVGACPLGSLQNALAASDRGTVSYVLGILLLFGLFLGRGICGYLCPVGLIQELLGKLPGRKLKKSRITRALSYVKYGVLFMLVILLPLLSGFSENGALPAFCKYVCPAGVLEGALPLLAHPDNAGLRALAGEAFCVKAGILLSLLVLAVFLYRPFCRFLCPLGALYSLFSRVSFTGIRVDKDQCVSCGRCLKECPVDIRTPGDRECVACGKCVDLCGAGAITLRAGKLVLRPNEQAARGPEETNVKRRSGKLFRVFRLLPVFVLTAVMIFVHVSSPRETVLPESGLPVLRMEDGREEALFEPGTVTVINFWAPWCAPCCRELPLFTELARKYPEKVRVILLHSGPVTEDPGAWISSKEYDPLLFGRDEEDEVSSFFGLTGVLPHTVVLSEEGRVLYSAPGTVTEELLESFLDERQQAGA